MMTEDEIANDALSKLSEQDKEELRTHIKTYGAIGLHHGFGTYIRNEYELWQRPWKPVIINEIDYAEDHPDQISMRIIEKILKKLEV